MSALPTAESAANSLNGLLQDDEVRDQFLPRLADAEVQAVERLLPPIWDSANEWVARYPFLNPDALLPTAVLKIVQMRQLSAADIATSVQWELWFLTLDDLFDGGQASLEELRAIADDCRRVAVTQPGLERPTTWFGSALADIKAQLTQHPTFEWLHPTFVSGLERLLDGSFYAYGMQRSAEMWSAQKIALDDYLFYGSRTLVHPFMWCLPLYDDQTVLPNLPALTELADQCSRVLRLANDLATWDREAAEGSLNAVAVEAGRLAVAGCERSDNERLLKAVGVMQLRLAQERRRAYELGSQVATRRRVEGGFVRLTELAADMYARRDLRKWRQLFTDGLL